MSLGQKEAKNGHSFMLKKMIYRGTMRNIYHNVLSEISFSWILANKAEILMSERQFWFDVDTFDQWHDLVA